MKVHSKARSYRHGLSADRMTVLLLQLWCDEAVRTDPVFAIREKTARAFPMRPKLFTCLNDAHA